jgi:hypothetical protein
MLVVDAPISGHLTPTWEGDAVDAPITRAIASLSRAPSNPELSLQYRNTTPDMQV